MASRKTQSTTVRLTAGDIAALDLARQRTGILSRSEALRFVLRFYVDSVQSGPEKPQPKTPKRKR
ncbi:MAG TPA: ribbon-helix-helix protein, CopG family [Polyangiaceae bacterium]